MSQLRERRNPEVEKKRVPGEGASHRSLHKPVPMQCLRPALFSVPLAGASGGEAPAPCGVVLLGFVELSPKVKELAPLVWVYNIEPQLERET